MLARNQVVRLLQVVTTYDGRERGIPDVAAWEEAARRRNWSFDEALDAVHEHFAEATGRDVWIMPGYITERIREKRRIPPPSNLIAASPRPAADPAHIRDCLRAVADRLGWPQRYDSHHPALAIRCPWCKAAPGRPCTRQIARGPKRGQFVPIAVPHPSRLDLIKKEGS